MKNFRDPRLGTRMRRSFSALILPVAAGLLCGSSCSSARAAETVFNNFESATYAPWTTTGTAFGSGPATGTLPSQMTVTGYEGTRLASSFNGGDGTTGKLISPDFVIGMPYIAFRIGGGGFAGQTCMNLIVEGQVVRTAVGPNTASGGSEELGLQGWNVQDLIGKSARIEVVDTATGG